jgi:hypothetical protein
MGSKKRLLIPLSLVQKKNMKEDGSFVILKQRSGQQFADPYYVFFPEQITLAQMKHKYCEQYRRKADMQPGEYRSHLFFIKKRLYSTWR